MRACAGHGSRARPLPRPVGRSFGGASRGSADRHRTLVLLLGLAGTLIAVANVFLSARVHGLLAGRDARPRFLEGFVAAEGKHGGRDAAAGNVGALPPVYWINLPSSVGGREAMLRSFASLGVSDHRRVDASYDEAAEALRMGRLAFRPDVEPGTTESHSQAARLLSHLNAIRQAYEDGRDLALILEDDAALSKFFLERWRAYVGRAPGDWRVLHFAAENPHAIRQGAVLREPFVGWQPYHRSSRAYLVSRDGMRALMDSAHFVAKGGEPGWRTQVPVGDPGEVVCRAVGDAYTSTGLRVDSVTSVGSTSRSEESNAGDGRITRSNNPASIMSNAREQIAKKISQDKFVFEDSLLVLTNVWIAGRMDVERVIRRIRQDYQAACQYHDKCYWEIDAAVADATLMEIFEQSTSDLPPSIHIRTRVTSDPNNEFSFVRDAVERMADCDLVLLKEFDLRLVGFPWRTFVERKENAVVSGPLRQSTDHRNGDRGPSFLEARDWLEQIWSSDLFDRVVPTEVPLIEARFALLDGAFARRFFGGILTPELMARWGGGGPEMLWCSAAKEWDDVRPSCSLVPVVADREDDGHQMDILGGGASDEEGERALEAFRNDPNVGKWTKVSTEWQGIVLGQSLPQVERRCRDLLGIEVADPFDLRQCTMKLIFSHWHYGYVPTARRRQVDTTKGTGSRASCPSPKEPFWEERRHRTRWEKHVDSAYTTVSCTGIHYRVPETPLRNIRISEQTLVIGVLSGASGDGPYRRNNVRSTWALGRSNVFFVVAGPWSQIEEEYEKYGDLLWLDMDEVNNCPLSL